MKAKKLRTCPRCGDHCYENLDTHAFCPSCNYAPEFSVEGFYVQFPDAALIAMSDEPKFTKGAL